MYNFHIIFLITSLGKAEITTDIGNKIYTEKNLVMKRILNNHFFLNRYLERPNLGDFTEACFGVLGPIGKYPQCRFFINISFWNHSLSDHCV